MRCDAVWKLCWTVARFVVAPVDADKILVPDEFIAVGVAREYVVLVEMIDVGSLFRETGTDLVHVDGKSEDFFVHVAADVGGICNVGCGDAAGKDSVS